MFDGINVTTNSYRYEKLEPAVKERFDLLMKAYAYAFFLITEQCESPIEKILGIALKFCGDIHGLSYKISPQTTIECADKTYRVDFLVSDVIDGQPINVIVECDGHDYHEKTKEQAKRDKKRDRDLTKLGYKILRFTGSEIMESPLKCADEVTSFFAKGANVNGKDRRDGD